MKHNYFLNRKERMEHAVSWAEKIKAEYHDEITNQILRSKIYENVNIINVSPLVEQTKIIAINSDSVNAIIDASHHTTGKMAVLNFASYKNPGGKFMEGSSAQEESLCHHSTLYPVLASFENEFYVPNKKRLHNALYDDNLIYTPDVLFIAKDETVLCDVITCAAPNKTAAKKYRKVEDSQILGAMASRIDAVLYAAYDNKVENLILGAFGCGVFGNDPAIVANIFAEFLNKKYRNCFKNVIFAIPVLHENDTTLKLFRRVLTMKGLI